MPLVDGGTRLSQPHPGRYIFCVVLFVVENISFVSNKITTFLCYSDIRNILFPIKGSPYMCTQRVFLNLIDSWQENI